MNMQQRPPEHKVTAPPPPPAPGGQSLEGGCGQGGLRARAPSPNTEPRVPQGGGTREVADLPPRAPQEPSHTRLPSRGAGLGAHPHSRGSEGIPRPPRHPHSTPLPPLLPGLASLRPTGCTATPTPSLQQDPRPLVLLSAGARAGRGLRKEISALTKLLTWCGKSHWQFKYIYIWHRLSVGIMVRISVERHHKEQCRYNTVFSSAAATSVRHLPSGSRNTLQT